MSEPIPGASPVSDKSKSPSEPWALSRWIAPAALLIAVIAVAVAVWALLRPPPASTTPPATSQQTADAKGRACTAYNTANAAVSQQTHIDLGSDPIAVQAVAVNARLSTAASTSYLLGRLDPATPAPLAAAIRSFADNLQDIAMNVMAGAPDDDPAQAARLRDNEAASARVADLCK
jgi:hypothetical protein